MKCRLVLFLLIFPTLLKAQNSDSIFQKYSVPFVEHLFKVRLYNDLYSYLDFFDKKNNNDFQHEKNYAHQRFLFETKIYSAQKFEHWKSCDTCFLSNYQEIILKEISFQKLNQLHLAFNEAPENLSLYFQKQKNTSLWKRLPDSVSTKNNLAIVQPILELSKDLLLHDTISFKQNEVVFLQQHPQQFKTSIENLNEAYNDLQQVKMKKAWKAGVLSAIIPGAGKMYYGNGWQGASVLLTLSVIGLQAYEGFHQKEINSIHGWAYTGLFSIFYVGNIWGSVLGIKVKQRKAYENIHRHLLDNADKLVQ